MTFDQWLDAQISGTTRRAYYSDNQLTAARDAWQAATAAEREDAQRLDWLESNCTQEPWDLRAFSAEQFADMRLKHKLPPMISTTCVGGPITLRDAIDHARSSEDAAIRSRGEK